MALTPNGREEMIRLMATIAAIPSLDPYTRMRADELRMCFFWHGPQWNAFDLARFANRKLL